MKIVSATAAGSRTGKRGTLWRNRQTWLDSGKGALAFAVLGLALMVVGLGVPSYWTDEAATASAATKALPLLWHMVGHLDLVHGFYYLLMQPWVALFGQGEWALRLPSALGFSATVGLVFAICRRWVSLRVALVAATLVLVLPSITRLGLEARSFALATAMVALSIYALLRASTVQADASPVARATDALAEGAVAIPRAARWWVVYALACVLMVAFQVYTVLVLPAHALLLVGTIKARLEAASAQGAQAQAPTNQEAAGSPSLARVTVAAVITDVLVRRWLVALAPVVVLSLAYLLMLRGQSKQLSEVYANLGERTLALAGAFVLGSFNGDAVGALSMAPLVGTALVLTLGFVLAWLPASWAAKARWLWRTSPGHRRLGGSQAQVQARPAADLTSGTTGKASTSESSSAARPNAEVHSRAASLTLNRWHLAGLTWWTVGPPLVVWTLAQMSEPFFAMRYWGFCAVGLVILAALGLTRLRGRWLVPLVVVALLCCLPMQWHQRQSYAKVGDNYRSVAQGVQRFAPQAVIYDRPQARGVALGYPHAFAGVRDLSAKQLPAQSDHLWGRSYGRAQVGKQLQQMRPQRLAVLASAREPLEKSAGLQHARTLGCHQEHVVVGGRFSAFLFTCPQ